jgi:hypothetical protein
VETKDNVREVMVVVVLAPGRVAFGSVLVPTKLSNSFTSVF